MRYDHNTALTDACRNRNTEIFKLLLEKGADVNSDPRKWNPLLNVLELSENLDKNKNDDVLSITEFLLEAKVDVNIENWEGIFPLMLAIKGFTRYKNKDTEKSKFFKIVQLLLENGAQVDKQELKQELKQENTALMMASEHGCVELVELLLKYKADKNIKNESRNKKTALIFAQDELSKLPESDTSQAKKDYEEILDFFNRMKLNRIKMPVYSLFLKKSR